VGAFLTICPRDDAQARQASDWCSDLQVELEARGHLLANTVNDRTPADRTGVETALQSPVDLVCYFGHGTRDAWLTHDVKTLDRKNATAAANRAIVSIACLTGRELGPEMVTAGAKAWLGFTINVPIVDPYKHVDPIGRSIVAGLSWFGRGANFEEVRFALQVALEVTSDQCESASGRFGSHPGRWLSY